MQTFLPFKDFARSAMVLDNKRLGKQRVEAKQIYLALTVPDYGWKNHPAVKMWQGCEYVLAVYGKFICREWIQRGFNDTLLDFFKAVMNSSTLAGYYPDWLGNEDFHRSHQSNLLRKDPVYYSRFFDVPDNLPYIWPKGKINE